MDIREVVSQLMAEIGDRLGIEIFMDEDGICCLEYGQDGSTFTIETVGDQNELLLYSPMGTLPTEDRAAFCERLLQANLYGEKTRGCILGLDEAQEEVVLSWRQRIDELDVIGLENVIGSFIETIEEVRPVVESPGIPVSRESVNGIVDLANMVRI